MSGRRGVAESSSAHRHSFCHGDAGRSWRRGMAAHAAGNSGHFVSIQGCPQPCGEVLRLAGRDAYAPQQLRQTGIQLVEPVNVVNVM